MRQADVPVSPQDCVAQTCVGVVVVQIQRKSSRRKMITALALTVRTRRACHVVSPQNCNIALPLRCLYCIYVLVFFIQIGFMVGQCCI